MDNEMNIREVIARIDTLLQAGEDEKAEKELVDAIAGFASVEPDNIIGQSILLNELGGFYRGRGIFDKGEEAYLKAKSLLEEIKCYECVVDAPVPALGDCACNAQALSKLCLEKDYGEPQPHTEIIYGNESMTINYATTLNNLAGLYRMSGQLQKAVETFDAAIEVYENCEEYVPAEYLASVYSNKGLVYLDMQKTSQAKDLFLNAKEILEKSGEYTSSLGTTLSNLGAAFMIEKNVSEATTLFKKAKTLFEKVGDSAMAQSCETLLTQLGVGE